jgi:TPR repeat protein
MIRGLLIGILIFVTGCAANNQAVRKAEGQSGNADNLLVIDCQLPGQVRKLGQNLTYLTPRRAIKTTAVDCEIRGGEYVAYDRANYKTALNIWLPQAKQGDPIAQTYVGEIYEKGLGIEADYAIAAHWYQQAAEQGYSRAQINLGYLYEGGLGVPRDLTKAMNWYRKASGLTDGDLEYVSSIEIANREAARSQSAQLKQEVEQLRGELGQTRKLLQRRKSALSAAERELAKLRKEFEVRKQSLRVTPVLASSSNPGTLDASDSERGKLAQELQDARQEQQRFIAKLASQQLEASRLRQDLEESHEQLEVRQNEFKQAYRKLEQMREELARLKMVESPKDNSETIHKLESKTASLQTKLNSQQQEISRLENGKQLQYNKLTDELNALHQKERQLEQALETRNEKIATLQTRLSNETKLPSGTGLQTQRQLEGLQQEQQRLTAKLARQQLEASALRNQLMLAQGQLDKRRIKLETAQSELLRTQASLEHMKKLSSSTTVDREKVKRLEAKQRDLQAMVKVQQQEVARLENELQVQQDKWSNDLQSVQDKEKQLRQTLRERNQEIAALQGQLASAQQQVAKSEQTQADLKALEQELRRRETEIVQQKEEIAQLQTQLEKGPGKLERSDFAVVVATKPVGPTIEVIDPPLSVTRGMPAITLRSKVPQIEIIGRVISADELLAFRINDKNQNIDKNGLFKVSMPVKEPKTPVSLVAIDKSGSRSAIDFVIIPKEVTAASAAGKEIDRNSRKESSDINFGEYHALIIGNNDYVYLTDLSTAVNDAKAVEEILRSKYGFKTQLLLNANRYTMLSALNQMRETLTENDSLLIYYAGHGELDDVNLRGHWLPTDAEPESDANWISNVAITDILNVMSAKHVLVVADSCYSGAMTRSSLARLQPGISIRLKAKWYKTMVLTRARVALTSGGLEPVLDRGGGEHSIFAKAFLEVLEENDEVLEGYRLYRAVYERVKQTAEKLHVDQEPQYAPIKYAGHEAGEFFLLPNTVAGYKKPGILTLVKHAHPVNEGKYYTNLLAWNMPKI